MPTFRGNETAPMQLLHFFVIVFIVFGYMYVLKFISKHIFRWFYFQCSYGIYYVSLRSSEWFYQSEFWFLVLFFREHFLIVSCVSSVFGVHFDQVFIGLFRKSRFVAFECLYEWNRPKREQWFLQHNVFSFGVIQFYLSL